LCVDGWACNRVPWLSTKLQLCSTSRNLVLSLLHLEGIIRFFTHYMFYPIGLPRAIFRALQSASPSAW
jgi:hypothetical protein